MRRATVRSRLRALPVDNRDIRGQSAQTRSRSAHMEAVADVECMTIPQA